LIDLLLAQFGFGPAGFHDYCFETNPAFWVFLAGLDFPRKLNLYQATEIFA